MKTDFFKTVKNWVIIWTVALIIMCIGFYIFIKARNSSADWLPMDTSSPSALYVNEGETLTAAKRNTMVESVKNFDIIQCDIVWSATSNSTITKTWNSSLCGWVSKLPKDYDNCIWWITYANSNNDHTHFFCTINAGTLGSWTSNYRLYCRFLCWDD